ncbi:MAG: hypothetical protein H0V62_12260 [Gammaproteobacteria bacterium]|nr:hypothetical protein [Gammaproteobacteria bacterium]MBA3731484.1 hypothetical protein [Gammaproteobacteria bacterium]
MDQAQTKQRSKVLVIVRGDVAEVYAEPGTDVCLVDYDNEPEAEIPKEYRHLLSGPSAS